MIITRADPNILIIQANALIYFLAGESCPVDKAPTSLKQ
jgi:hypothetical protein